MDRYQIATGKKFVPDMNVCFLEEQKRIDFNEKFEEALNSNKFY